MVAGVVDMIGVVKAGIGEVKAIGESEEGETGLKGEGMDLEGPA